jgi:hypothetical protein
MDRPGFLDNQFNEQLRSKLREMYPKRSIAAVSDAYRQHLLGLA